MTESNVEQPQANGCSHDVQVVCRTGWDPPYYFWRCQECGQDVPTNREETAEFDRLLGVTRK